MTSTTLWATPLRRALSLLTLAAMLAVPASATTYVVNSLSDDPADTDGTPDGQITLREALIAANSDAPYGDAPAGTGDDTITFNFNNLAGGFTLTLQQGELAITDGVTIDGSGVFGLRITTPTNIPKRLFNIATTDNVVLGGMELVGGFAPTGGGVLLGAGGNLALDNVDFTGNRAMDGGALYVSAGAMVELLDGTSFTGNRANGSASTNGGGAIYTAGDVSGDAFDTVNFNNNRATVGAGSGGAVYIADGGSFTVVIFNAAAARGGRYVFDGNRAARAGGAIEVREGGSTDVQDANFFDNLAGPNPGNGGALHISGAGLATLTNCSFGDNVASAEGGALWNSATGTLTVNGGTFNENRARGTDPDQGGGAIYSDGGDTDVDGGSFSGNSAVDGGGSGGAIFSNGATFTITNANIGGFTWRTGSGGLVANRAARAGGGIEVRGGTMTITDSFINTNSTGASPGNGGGLHISSDGDVTLTTSQVNGNYAVNEGGGLWNSGTGTLTIVSTMIEGNSTNGNGGGVYQQGTVAKRQGGGMTVISNSTISNNSARTLGGGVFAEGAAMAILNSTLSGNSAVRGGGGAVESASVSIQSSTIAANTASGRGGGFANPDIGNRVQIQNTLVADNMAPAGPELSGYYLSQGHNLVETRDGAGISSQSLTDIYGTDAMIGPLADNGGPTMTHALLAGSPAIDAGMSTFETDQRGEPRTDPDDIGAFHLGMPAAVGAMVITGVFDGPLTGGVPKVVELYVTEDIADLGLFGLGSANNGGGTDGEEFSFPDGDTATAGDFIYVATGTAEFQTYFGIPADYDGGSATNVNGDDAIELFLNDAVVDVYGDIAVDGSGEVWDYLDGWAYRVDTFGPDGTTFVPGNWTYSEINANDGETSNGTAAMPFPIGTYSPTLNGQGQTASKLGDADVVTGLAPVAPNPIRSTARVQFSVAQSEAVSVDLYDMMGRRVQSLYTGTPTAETVMDVAIDASGLASGVYVVVLSSQTTRETQRVTVAR